MFYKIPYSRLFVVLSRILFKAFNVEHQQMNSSLFLNLPLKLPFKLCVCVCVSIFSIERCKGSFRETMPTCLLYPFTQRIPTSASASSSLLLKSKDLKKISSINSIITILEDFCRVRGSLVMLHLISFYLSQFHYRGVCYAELC